MHFLREQNSLKRSLNNFQIKISKLINKHQQINKNIVGLIRKFRENFIMLYETLLIIVVVKKLF